MEPLPNGIHPSWNVHLQPLFDDPKMKLIKEEILPQTKFYPEGKDIFRVFNAPLHSIKAVIVGQDPYHNGEATGLAFGVRSGVTLPASLKIIKKEVEASGFHSNGEWRTLQHWEKQGVFLLNISLTVEAKRAGSHMGFWYWFAREVIKTISIQCKPVWMLWGAKAQSFKDYISEPKIDYGKTEQIEIYSKFNVILEAPHPAAETYGTSSKKFSGCNHFSLCNKILEIKKQSIINW